MMEYNKKKLYWLVCIFQHIFAFYFQDNHKSLNKKEISIICNNNEYTLVKTKYTLAYF